VTGHLDVLDKRETESESKPSEFGMMTYLELYEDIDYGPARSVTSIIVFNIRGVLENK
jgi:hypothetical protein